VLNFDGETGPYVQYTHARIASVIRNAGGVAAEKSLDINNCGISYITGDSAYELVKLIYKFPAVISDAAEKYEPSILTRHIVDIAQAFNRFYHDEHILVENEEEKAAKLALTYSAKTVLKNGLGLLGMAAPEKM
jgi:arginyl-tRNA synthetase